MPFDVVLDVIERELKHPVEEAFTWIDEQPLAAASIGQVHAARLTDSREVVVKVQYPGVGEAIRADLQNTEMIASFARMGSKLAPIRMTADPRAIAEEIFRADHRGAGLPDRSSESVSVQLPLAGSGSSISAV